MSIRDVFIDAENHEACTVINETISGTPQTHVVTKESADRYRSLACLLAGACERLDPTGLTISRPPKPETAP